jgi:uncharacterized membrane protein
MTIFSALIAGVWLALGFLLFWRRSDDWLALLAALFLVMQGITLNANSLFALALTVPGFEPLFGLISLLAALSLSAFLLVFPTGRVVPRWIGLLLLPDILYNVAFNFPSPIAPYGEAWLGAFGGLSASLVAVIPGAILLAQVYRYWRVSTPAERQQTKWVVLGVAAPVVAFLGLFGLTALSVLNNTLLVNLVWTLTLPIASLAIPLSIGFSILRYRLYDIDTLINQALVYGSLTAILAGFYFGVVLATQTLLRGFAGAEGGQPVVIVITTLAAAAFITPLRHRIQAVIDRAFYRSKYDARLIVARFGAQLRMETDLEDLNGHLLEVVWQTMRPTHANLWLRPPRLRDSRAPAGESAQPPQRP